MRRFYLILLSVFLSFEFAHGQIEDGYNLIGGTSSIGFNNNGYAFNLSPDIGRFVADRFVIGGQMDFRVSHDNTYTDLTISVIPIFRYYFGKSKTKFFIHGGIGLGCYMSWYEPWYSYASTKVKESNTEINYDVRAGIAHFINNNVAIETSLTCKNYLYYGNLYWSFGIDVGFQIHIFRLFKRNKEQ